MAQHITHVVDDATLTLDALRAFLDDAHEAGAIGTERVTFTAAPEGRIKILTVEVPTGEGTGQAF